MSNVRLQQRIAEQSGIGINAMRMTILLLFFPGWQQGWWTFFL